MHMALSLHSYEHCRPVLHGTAGARDMRLRPGKSAESGAKSFTRQGRSVFNQSLNIVSIPAAN